MTLLFLKIEYFKFCNFFNAQLLNYDGISPFCRFYYFHVSLHSKFIHLMDKIEYNNIFLCIDTNFVKMSESV